MDVYSHNNNNGSGSAAASSATTSSSSPTQLTAGTTTHSTHSTSPGTTLSGISGTNDYNNSSQSGQSQGSQSSQSQQPAASVPAACLACRGKHLKCDGMTPCSRCLASNSECIYIASRRGYKGPRRNTAANPNKRHASSSPDVSSSVSSDNCPMLLGHTSVSAHTVPASTMTAVSGFHPAVVLPATEPAAPYVAAPPGGMASLQVFRNPYLNGTQSRPMAVIPPTQNQPSLPERCFDAFYHFFHAGHPFVLPRVSMVRLMKEGTTNLDAVVAAMRYIGSLYVDAGPARAMYLDDAIRLCYQPTTPKDGFLIQALLLIIIGLDGSCQQERAREILADCERIALEINLNTRSFATMHGRGNPVMEESWRRTWWDLYVCDGMIAGVHRVTNFLLFDIVADVALPCEEDQYLRGDIPQPMYMEDFDDQLFSGEDRPFSSFAYRIAAARNLGRFMRTPVSLFPGDENVAKIESLLTNWRMHLPEPKRHNVDKKCQLDEMMFQGHFITHACSIMLHQPLSQLDSSPARAVTSCAPHRPIASGDSYNIHTQHTITAAYEISQMITQPVPVLSHTHFFTCVITLSSIVHLSKWALYFLPEEEDLRQQIRLNIGALTKISEVWKAANTACGQVKGVAQEIYRTKKAHQINPAFWVGFTQEEMISSLNADEEIMQEFEGMLAVTQPQ